MKEIRKKRIFIYIFLTFFLLFGIIFTFIKYKGSYSVSDLPSYYNLKVLGKVTPVVKQAKDSCTVTSLATVLDSYILCKWDSTILSKYDWSASKNIMNPSHINWWQKYVYGENVIDFFDGSGRAIYPFVERGFASYNDFNYKIEGSSYSTTPNRTTTLNAHSKIRIVSNATFSNINYESNIINKIKETIYNYGAVSYGGVEPAYPIINGAAGGWCFNKTTGAFYCYPNEQIKAKFMGGHQMTIIGWDDDYSKENFGSTEFPNMKPTNNGAFIIQNSWGTTNNTCSYQNYCPNGGIFYFSYENLNYLDDFSGSPMDFYTYITKVIPNETDHIYSHDFVNYPIAAGLITEPATKEIDNSKEVIMKFDKASANEIIEQINSIDTSVGGYIYFNPTGIINNYPLDDERSGFIQVSSENLGYYRGIYTEFLKENIRINNNFAIGLKSNQQNVKFSYGESVTNNNALKIIGRTYAYVDSEWKDVSTYDYYDSTNKKYIYYYSPLVKIYTNEVNSNEPIIEVEYNGNNNYKISARASTNQTLSNINEYKYFISSDTSIFEDVEWQNYSPGGTSFSANNLPFGSKVYVKNIKDNSGNITRNSGTEFYLENAIPCQSFNLKIYNFLELDATLSSLSVTGYNISPAFNANTTSYTLSVPTNISSITINATANYPTYVSSIVGTGVKTLSYGANTFNIVVTAADGVTTKTYVVVVTRALNNDATLSSLSVTGYNISPTFNTNTTSYILSVPTNISSITINGTKSDTNASVTGMGVKTLSYSTNTFNIVVTAADGVTTKTYVVVVTRALNNDATLSSLSVTGYNISPTFNTNTTSYTLNVTASTLSVTIAAVATDSEHAIVIGVGTKILNSGNNTYNVVVTAADGVTTKTYIVVVKKEEMIELVEESEYIIEDEYILIEEIGTGIDRATFVSNILTNLNNYNIYESDGETIAGNVIKTGQIIKVDMNDYYISIMGDTNGDGISNINDIMKIGRHLYQSDAKLIGPYEKAGNINKNTGIDFFDIMQLAVKIYGN